MTTTDDTRASVPVESIVRALHVVEELARSGPTRVGELASRLAVPKPTVQRALLTLEHAGWIERVGTDATQWALTARIRSTVSGSPAAVLSAAAGPELARLRDATGDSVHLLVPRDFGTLVVQERAEGRRAVRTVIPLQHESAITSTAAGYSLLAAMEPDIAERIVAQQCPEPDEFTTVRRAIAQARAHGYATRVGWDGDVVAVAAAIPGSRAIPSGAVSLSIPSGRWTSEDAHRLGALVAESAARLGAVD
ncbi:helix-turn-helix domain-containing protein [Microbacterium trichothecenolyticum]|uniref:IclR family transcriptional regulator n=1 Tax=Microbacterium trichothecenolyticum TaxID=69370 RepID=UPI001C6E5370|nr:helix-turn-helix domain-containing protein [Microbacterium trichothecenolyticum]MBW9122327.1 helix-turn-helix domain-containing protein [Microbacterium trichothecenolyticum]